MREIIEAIILGIIQGLTEFLPVSSSGHIELGQWIMGSDTFGEQEVLISVVLHAATAFATLFVFRKDVLDILKGLFQFKWNEQTQFSAKIILSMIPAAAVGVLFDEQLDALFNGQIVLVGCMLLITGLLLFLADKAKNTNKNVGFMEAIIVGVAQAIAIMPGISRSGATISTSVLLGIDRDRAARFSFLMVVPLILGKMAKDILDGEFVLQGDLVVPLAAGFAAAFFTGIIACMWMIKLVKKSQLSYFAYYCFIVGITVIVVRLAMG